MTKWLTAILVLVAACSAQGATWRVERDGSGDYSVIQDAVDAAASGDTILIGPGRYDEGKIVTTAGWTEKVRVLVTQAELTLIGAGPDQTIIGPSTPYDRTVQGDDRGIVTGPYFGNYRVWVMGIGFENMWGGVVGTSAPDTEIDNCRFLGSYHGVVSSSNADLKVSNCDFQYIDSRGLGILLYTNSMNNVEVWNCNFTLVDNGPGYQVAVQFDTTLDVNIHDCNFFAGKYGLQFSGTWGSVAEVANCHFSGQSQNGLILKGLVSALVHDCLFDQQGTAIYAGGYLQNGVLMSEADIQRVVIQDVQDSAIDLYAMGDLRVNDSYLAHGATYTIQEVFNKDAAAGLPVLDLTNNDWGTTDAETIASWIHLVYYEADFIPYVGQPVGNEAVGWGDLKAQFR